MYIYNYIYKIKYIENLSVSKIGALAQKSLAKECLPHVQHKIKFEQILKKEEKRNIFSK